MWDALILNSFFNGFSLVSSIIIKEFKYNDVIIIILMDLMYKIFTISIIFLITIPIATSTNKIVNSDEELNVITIRIAHYPMLGSSSYPTLGSLFDFKHESIELRDISGAPQFSYTWKVNDTVYTFTEEVLSIDEMKGEGDRPLNVENYDLLYVGVNYWSYFRDGILYKRITENIESFLSDGGGYIGSCAGTTFATQGFENPKSPYQFISNFGVLKVADVYMNQEWMGEMQYCIRSKAALPPVNLKIEKTEQVPIFENYADSHINMTYGGGPGLYIANNSNPKLGEITPLLTFEEELMETKPIHWFRKGILPGWIPFKKVKTDLKGCYAGVATTYDNAGRIVLFSTHAEIPLVVNGTIEEGFGERSGYGSFNKIQRTVYYWNGELLNISKNWWIHRRAAAWVAGVPNEDIPPCNELMVLIDTPFFRYGVNEFYYNGEGIIYGFGNSSDENACDIDKPSIETAEKIVEWTGMTTIAGNITISSYGENSDMMEFYVDGELQYIDYERPFSWKIKNGNLTGIHRFEARSYDEYGNYAFDGSNFFFIKI